MNIKVIVYCDNCAGRIDDPEPIYQEIFDYSLDNYCKDCYTMFEPSTKADIWEYSFADALVNMVDMYNKVPNKRG